MKPVYLTIIISAAIIVSVLTFAIVMQPIHQNQPDAYVITDYHPNTTKIWGTDIVQNQIFHFADYNMSATLPKPYWIEMYDTNFTFPDGLQISHTPGGAIFQTYVTFPNETVPYKISTGLGENTDHKTVTILSIHKDPQAGYAIYNNTVRLLVNWPKIHPEIMINNFNGAYKTDQPIDFQIEVKGFDYYDAGEQPNVEIEKPDGSLVWKSSGPYIVMCCPAELVNYDKTFNFTNLGGPVTIDKPGSYNLMVSYNGQKIQKQFTVVQSVTSIFDTGVYPFSTDVTNTNFTINYNITGNGKIFDAKMNTNSQTLAVLINATEDGQLVIVLPRNMIHSTTYTNMDDMFIVLSNQQEIQYKEFHNTLDARTLLIPFQKGVDKIEIIGTSPI
ncbi:MAG: hypothetical protein LV477_01665 [Candidatus Nitrosotalea sp.]|nr:hypothetical protein [Candidatus Nitrosotalea sp.]